MIMRKNEHLGALVRISALQIAFGDTSKAEEILKWAYAPFLLENDAKQRRTEDGTKTPQIQDKTGVFIERYLTVREGVRKSEVRQFMREFVLKPDESLDYELISDHINDMEYKDFLATVYWRGISLAVKERDGKACQICGANTNLAAHHLNYLNHGDELHHLEDLQCVCRSCHEKSHGINQEEPGMEEEKTIPEEQDCARKRYPKVASALSLKDIVEEKPSELIVGAAWLDVCRMYEHRPRLFNTLRDARPKIKEQDNRFVVSFPVKNMAQEQWMNEKLVRDIELNLRKCAKFNGIDVVIECPETKDTA